MQPPLQGSLRSVYIGVYVVFRYHSRLLLPSSLRDRIIARTVFEKRIIVVGQRLTKHERSLHAVQVSGEPLVRDSLKHTPHHIVLGTKRTHAFARLKEIGRTHHSTALITSKVTKRGSGAT